METVPERIKRMLNERGLPWEAPIEHHETIGSTSDRAKELAREGAPEWTVVRAERQTEGRGRQGSRWVSPAGNVFLSVVLRPAMPADMLALLPLTAGVAVCDALRTLGLAAELKWPNDVLARGRKVAGILAETTSSAGTPEAVVLGIGVNVGLDLRELPPELRQAVTSVAAETGRAGDAASLVAEVLARLTVWYDALAQERARVISEWRARSIPWWGRLVEVRSGADVVRGVARGVDERGALLLEVEGRPVPVLSGEAREVRLANP